jgi:hypothetical protein
MQKTKPDYRLAIQHTGILEKLASFQPAVAGTAPLGLSIGGSDIDILCCAEQLDAFEQVIWDHFRNEDAFSLRRWVSEDRPVIAVFKAHGWPFQIFGSQTPVKEQIGWSLFQAELRLIEIGGDRLKTKIVRLRNNGLKTIPAIACLLGLEGDPFQALLAIGKLSDADLAEIITRGRGD